MRKKLQHDRGFTLAELIVALAVLAFLMVAVSSFMGSSVMNNRKAKADIKVVNDAQLVYNQITDCLMQARNVVIVGRVFTISDPNDTTPKLFDFENRESGSGVAAGERVLIVKDDDMRKKVKNNADFYGLSELDEDYTSVLFFKDLAASDYIYVDELIIETAVPIDMDDVPMGVSGVAGTFEFSSPLTGESNIKVKGTKSDIDATKIVYDKDDTCVHRFSADGRYLYYGKRYYIMTKIDDVLNLKDSDNKKLHVYSNEMGYVECKDKKPAPNAGENKTITGFGMKINPLVSQFKIDMYFSSDFKNDTANMSYDTEDRGMVNIRNSHVLMDK